MVTTDQPSQVSQLLIHAVLILLQEETSTVTNTGQLFNLLTVIPTSKGNFLLLQCFYILDNSISSKQFS